MPKYNVIVCYSKPEKWPGVAKETKQKLLREAFNEAARGLFKYGSRGASESEFYNDVKKELIKRGIDGVFLSLRLEATSEEDAKRQAQELAFHAFGEGNYLTETVPSFEKLIEPTAKNSGSIGDIALIATTIIAALIPIAWTIYNWITRKR
jgi:hypothetical protein